LRPIIFSLTWWMDGASPTVPQAQSRASAMAWFEFLRENPAVKSQLPSRARLERRASSGTYKRGRCLHETGRRAPRVCLHLSDMLRLRKLPTCISNRRTLYRKVRMDETGNPSLNPWYNFPIPRIVLLRF
jgi:hypothetical protein